MPNDPAVFAAARAIGCSSCGAQPGEPCDPYSAADVTHGARIMDSGALPAPGEVARPAPLEVLITACADLLHGDDCTKYYDVPGSAPGRRYAEALLAALEQAGYEVTTRA